jgi:hypothetical protein
LLSRGSPLRGDRRHSSDLILDQGISARKVACTCYAITAALATVGCASLRCNATCCFLASALSLGIVAAALIRLGALRADDVHMHARLPAAKRHLVSTLPVTGETQALNALSNELGMVLGDDYVGLERMVRVPRRLRS